MKQFSIIVFLLAVAGIGAYFVSRPTASACPEVAQQDLVDHTAIEIPMLVSSATVQTISNESIMLQSMKYGAPDGVMYRYKNCMYFVRFTDNHSKNERPVLMANADPDSFNILSTGLSFDTIAKDKNNVYCRGSILPGADAASLEPVLDKGAKDKVHTYSATTCTILQ